MIQSNNTGDNSGKRGNFDKFSNMNGDGNGARVFEKQYEQNK